MQHQRYQPKGVRRQSSRTWRSATVLHRYAFSASKASLKNFMHSRTQIRTRKFCIPFLLWYFATDFANTCNAALYFATLHWIKNIVREKRNLPAPSGNAANLWLDSPIYHHNIWTSICFKRWIFFWCVNNRKQIHPGGDMWDMALKAPSHARSGTLP